MKKIEACTLDLIQAIMESQEYQQFCKVRDKVRENPEMRAQLMEFRSNVFELQNSAEPLDMYEEQVNIGRKYEALRKNPLIMEFLNAELRVCRIFQRISMDIADHIDLDANEIVEHIQL